MPLSKCSFYQAKQDCSYHQMLRNTPTLRSLSSAAKAFQSCPQTVISFDVRETAWWIRNQEKFPVCRLYIGYHVWCWVKWMGGHLDISIWSVWTGVTGLDCSCRYINKRGPNSNLVLLYEITNAVFFYHLSFFIMCNVVPSYFKNRRVETSRYFLHWPLWTAKNKTRVRETQVWHNAIRHITIVLLPPTQLGESHSVQPLLCLFVSSKHDIYRKSSSHRGCYEPLASTMNKLNRKISLFKGAKVSSVMESIWSETVILLLHQTFEHKRLNDGLWYFKSALIVHGFLFRFSWSYAAKQLNVCLLGHHINHKPLRWTKACGKT